MNFAFTYCPTDKYQFVSNPNRMKTAVKHFHRIISRNLPCDTSYEMYVELSKPEQAQDGKMSRIHWHGLLSFKDWSAIQQFYCENFHNLTKYARIEIKEIEDEDNMIKWMDYATKDAYKMEKYCDKCQCYSVLTHELDKPANDDSKYIEGSYLANAMSAREERDWERYFEVIESDPLDA